MKVGCCGFPLTKDKYAGIFSVVEVQQTFYQPPQRATLERWRAAVPNSFEFTLKAWQLITHWANSPTYKRFTTQLTETERQACGGFQASGIVDEAWLTTRACAEALDAKRVLFQCPASFTPSPGNISNLRRFFARLQRHGLRLFWEPRGAWPPTLVESLCCELDLTHVVDPFVGQTMTGGTFYYRLHGGPGYRHRFDDVELSRLSSALPTDRGGYVMFNNVSMFDDAVRFQRLVQTRDRASAESGGKLG